MAQNPNPSPPALLSLRGIHKRFGALEVLRGINLDVAQGEFLALLGASGSGKTTILRLIAGFERADQGEIHMAGGPLDPLPPFRRPVNTVFQNYALFPHLSVFENVAYGLKAKKVAAAHTRSRVQQILEKMGLTQFARALPARLSGGQQQRVALARALVNQPQLLLLDEPLSALDANMRREMQLELKKLQRDVGIAFVFVTHDQEEAMALADRIALLRSGVLEQVDTPRGIYHRPASVYAAQFVGKTNLLHAQVSGGLATCGALAWPCRLPDGPASFSLRPEKIRITSRCDTATGSAGRAEPGSEPPASFCASISDQLFGGAMDLIEVVCRDGQHLLVRASSREAMAGEWRFDFSPEDAFPLLK